MASLPTLVKCSLPAGGLRAGGRSKFSPVVLIRWRKVATRPLLAGILGAIGLGIRYIPCGLYYACNWAAQLTCTELETSAYAQCAKTRRKAIPNALQHRTTATTNARRLGRRRASAAKPGMTATINAALGRPAAGFVMHGCGFQTSSAWPGRGSQISSASRGPGSPTLSASRGLGLSTRSASRGPGLSPQSAGRLSG